MSADDIREAVRHIPAEFGHSPQFISTPLSALAGREVVVKVETVNPIGAFKGRGAWLAVQRLVEQGRAAAGVVADSVPELEWQETEAKARALIRAAELVEEGF